MTWCDRIMLGFVIAVIPILILMANTPPDTDHITGEVIKNERYGLLGNTMFVVERSDGSRVQITDSRSLYAKYEVGDWFDEDLESYQWKVL